MENNNKDTQFCSHKASDTQSDNPGSILVTHRPAKPFILRGR